MLYYKITDCILRKRFAVTFIATGLTLLFWLPYVAIILNIQLLPLALILIGLALFITRNKYRLHHNHPPHPLLRAPTMNLAADCDALHHAQQHQQYRCRDTAGMRTAAVLSSEPKANAP